jgi:hypothetical protein
MDTDRATSYVVSRALMGDATLYLEEVFKRSGLPTYTFVEPREYSHLKVALRTPGRGVIIEGPSGIGKTTAVLTAVETMGLAHKVQKLSARVPNDVELIALIPDLVESRDGAGLVIVDDFHRLADDLKHRFADIMKDMADREDSKTKLVLIGINRAGNSLVDFAPDLNNRIDTIRFEINSIESVRELISKGERALNISISCAESVANDAGGSFHIAQILCHELCLIDHITETAQEPLVATASLEAVKDRVINELARTFSKPAVKFARGPRFRRVGRAPYLHLLRWLADSEQGTLTIDGAMALHPEHRGSVGQIVEKEYLSRFLMSHDDLQDIVHFDDYTKVLAIEDPKFIYYLRNLLWSKFVREAGFINMEFKSKYDFAMSFAGEVRPVVQRVKDLLIESEVEVFYDLDEQHRIISMDVEDYLAPIYRTEARYVVVFLSEDYPRKIWTKFESDHFKARFGSNSVIPVRFTNVGISVFDITYTIGGLSFDPDADLPSQAEKIANTLLRRLEEDRATETEAIRVEAVPEAANDAEILLL